MTYVNANVYTTEPTAWAHDDCLPDSEFYAITINGKTADEYGEPYGRQQKSPWHWWPVYGAPMPCAYCPEPVR